MKNIVTILLITIICHQVFAQQTNEFRAWKLTNYSGYVGIRGFYREQERVLKNFEEYSYYPFLYGGIALNTNSYVLHPNLLLLNIGGEYNPGTANQRYTVSPDRSEVLNISKLDIQGIFFNSKPMNLIAYINLARNLINREYVSSTKTDSKNWGLKYNFRNKILPVTISYNNRKWDQEELETNRNYFNDQKNFEARASKSFTKYNDQNEILVRHNDFFRREANLTETHNIFKSINIINRYYLDRNKRYMFRSYINNLDQTGTVDQVRFQLRESIDLKLPFQFRLGGSYQLFDIQQRIQGNRLNRININLQHQLFNSLKTDAFYDYSTNDHTSFDETNLRFGGSINYAKKIPTGTFGLIYSYRRHNQAVIGDSNKTIQIIDEQQVLSDGEIILLNQPYVRIETVVVKDALGVIIYDEGFDYILIERNGFVELVRIPGGQIANGSAVLVDYTTDQIGSYQFVSSFNAFTVRFNILDNHLELFYSLSNQDYSDLEGSELISLNYFDRYSYGVRVNIWAITAGVERDDYRSSIVPYDRFLYSLRMSGKAGKKLLLSLNGSVTDQKITLERIPQLYASIFGKMVYMIKPKTKLDFDIGYRKQVGEQIDLDMITAKLEANTSFRNLYARLGFEVYRRNYIGEELNFKGIYFQIDRKF
ncbi:MAG: hypothetical protein ABFS32_00025 [Bacteroidota bacterium]